MPVQCSHTSSHGKRCAHDAAEPRRLCQHHLLTRSRSKQRVRRALPSALCRRCMQRPPRPDTRHCPRCVAYWRERKLPHLEHDLQAHTEMLTLADDPKSLCAATGRALLALRKVGERLTVDRISPYQGYVSGNMQLLSGRLNSAKGVGDDVPREAVRRLLRRLEHVFDDRLSEVPGATYRD
jgi:hypothetical protein